MLHLILLVIVIALAVVGVIDLIKKDYTGAVILLAIAAVVAIFIGIL